MPDAPLSAPEATPKARRRGRHRTSYLLLAFVGGVLFLANVPGQVVVGSPADRLGPLSLSDARIGLMRCDHGWPLVFLRRDPDSLLDANAPASGPSVQAVLWNLSTGVVAFSEVALAADLAVALGILVASGWFYARWRRRRGNWQFYMIDFAGLVIVIAALLGWRALRVERHRKDTAALALMSDLVSPRWQPGGPSWVRELSSEPPMTMQRGFWGILRWSYRPLDARRFATFDYVAGMEFQSTARGDPNRYETNLEQVPQFKSLTWLSLPRLRRREWNCLQTCPQIRAIYVHSFVESDDLEGLPPNSSLVGLALGSAEIPKSALFVVSRLPNLKALELSFRTRPLLTQVHVRQIAGLSELRELTLRDANIAQGALNELPALKGLERLDFALSNVGDDSIPALARVSTLKDLNLNSTKVTDEGAAELQRHLPSCRILR